MKRNKINKRVPTYKFGLDQAGSLAGILGTTLSATGNDTMGAVGGALSGAASGAALGPIGMAGGAILGGVTSLLGSNARKKAEEAAKKRKAEQETMNMAKNQTAQIQQEYGEENPLAYTFANGGIMPGNLAYVDDGEVIREPNGNTYDIPEQGQSTDQNLVSLPEYSSILSDSIKFKELGNKTPAQYYKEKSSKVKYGNDMYAQNSAKLNKQNNDNLYNNLLALQTQDNYMNDRKNKAKTIPAYAKGTPLSSTLDWTKNMASLTSDIPSISLKPSSLSNTSELASPATKVNRLPTNYTNAPETKSRNFDFGSLLSLAPVAYNFAQSLRKPELEEPIENPYTSTITSTLANRRYNINPALQANARARAISNYNISQTAPNTGASMAQRVQSSLGQYASNIDLYGIAQNYNNQYASDYANTLNSLGQQSVSAQTAVATQNRAARTAREAFAGTAASQLGQWSQTQQQMANQRTVDRAILPALKKYLSAGHTTNELQNIMSPLKRHH